MKLVISFLVFATIYLLVFQFYSQRQEKIHLPSEPAEAGFNNLKNKPRRELFFLLRPIIGLISAKLPLENLKRRLITAGAPLGLVDFLGFKLLSTILLPIIVFVIFKAEPPWLIISACFGFLIPDLWLNQKIKRRHLEISRDLPTIIDLLDLYVGAGLDFMQAVNWIVKEFKKCAITEELSEAGREIQMGKTRREALKNLANRVNLPEVSSLVRVLVTADRMGSPLSEALRIQSEQIRTRRFQRGEELALKAPIKLLFPLLVFILPVVLIIVAGPIVLQFLSGGIRF